ncbi:MAG: hypothetical protein KC656_33005, partial [Myxococcales bacterium]|nr:hypothetical protein [Myxococcales bacterium]
MTAFVVSGTVASAAGPVHVEWTYCPDGLDRDRWHTAAEVWEHHRVVIDGEVMPRAPESQAPEVVYTLRLALKEAWTEHTVARVTVGEQDLLLRQSGDTLILRQAPRHRAHLDFEGI